MKVYAVDAKDGEPRVYYATKRDALKEARRAAREYAPAGETVEITEVALVPMTKAAIVRLLNIEGKYVDDERVVDTLPSRRKESE